MIPPQSSGKRNKPYYFSDPAAGPYRSAALLCGSEIELRRRSRATIILSVKPVKKWEVDPERYHLGRQRWSMLRSEQQGLPNLPLRR